MSEGDRSFHIQSFSSGMDLRKSPLTSPAGTLRELNDCHITQGGEVEKRLAFVDRGGPLPAESIGLAGFRDRLVTFVNTAGSTTSPDPSLIDVKTLTTDDTLIKLHDYDVYDNKLYVSVQTDTKEVAHFYDGVEVPPRTDGYHGEVIRTYKSKIHALGIGKSDLLFSAIDNPADWNGTGSGFVNISVQDADSSNLNGLEVYYDRLAVQSLRSTTTWAIDQDPALYELDQILRQAGTISHRSMKQIGAGDVLYASDTGIRSLQARDSSNSAAVSDIGSPIDSLVVGLVRGLTAPDLDTITSLVEPLSGRFFVIFPDRALVLSFFPSPKITAWSQYIFPFTHTYSAATTQLLGFRGTDDIVRTYGGISQVYDATQARVLFPFLFLDQPGVEKDFQSLDVSCEGSWNIAGCTDVHSNVRDTFATVDGPTFGLGSIASQGNGTHIQLEMTSQGDGPALLNDAIIYYNQVA